MDRQDDRGYRRGPSSAPIKVGDVAEVTIEAVGEKGDGLAKISGFVLFVPGVKQGDKVQVKVTRVLRSVGFAEVVGSSSSSDGESSSKKPARKEYDEEGSGDDAEASDDVGAEEEPEQAAEDSEDF